MIILRTIGYKFSKKNVGIVGCYTKAIDSELSMPETSISTWSLKAHLLASQGANSLNPSGPQHKPEIS